MRYLSAAAVAACLLTTAGCGSPAQNSQTLNTLPGKLFCSIQLAGGGAILANLVDRAATKATPGAGPLVVVATGQTRQYVNDACQAAAQQTPGAMSGAPVSPPAASAPVQQLDVVAPLNPVTPPAPAWAATS